jgi:ADP-ribose pyrophosphatase YjhB (NUDIX family)
VSTNRDITAKAICVFRHDDRILVALDVDSTTDQRYARPLGGAIDFGERAEDALRREIMEEIGAELAAPRVLGVFENIFTLEGRPRHEILFVFDAQFADTTLYESATIEALEPGWGEPPVWMPLSAFRDGSLPLYPAGLLALLDRHKP